MQNQIVVQIVSKLAETVLQIRLETKKQLFKDFQELFSSVKNQSKALVSLSDFLSQVLQRDSYRMVEKLTSKWRSNKMERTLSLQIIFSLSDKKTGKKINAEQWSFMITRFKDQPSQSTLLLTIDFFEQVVLFLNKLPLFSVYQHDKELKSRFYLDYSILAQKQKESNLLEMRSQHILSRKNQQILLSVRIAYLSSLDFLIPKSYFSQCSKRKESTTSSDYICEKKVSVYAFYDPDLDFTFLSSDQENFKTQDKGEEIKMDVVESDVSEEFQLLIANEDQDFVDDAKENFDFLENNLKAYFC